jgi:hypothetical protein
MQHPEHINHLSSYTSCFCCCCWAFITTTFDRNPTTERPTQDFLFWKSLQYDRRQPKATE